MLVRKNEWIFLTVFGLSTLNMPISQIQTRKTASFHFKREFVTPFLLHSSRVMPGGLQQIPVPVQWEDDHRWSAGQGPVCWDHGGLSDHEHLRRRENRYQQWFIWSYCDEQLRHLPVVWQVSWRWYQPCFSWGTWRSRRNDTLTRRPCLTTPVTHPHFLNAPHLSLYLILIEFLVTFLFSATAAQKVCHLLGINVTEFIRAILSPKIKVCIIIHKYWKEKH